MLIRVTYTSSLLWLIAKTPRTQSRTSRLKRTHNIVTLPSSLPQDRQITITPSRFNCSGSPRLSVSSTLVLWPFGSWTPPDKAIVWSRMPFLRQRRSFLTHTTHFRPELCSRSTLLRCAIKGLETHGRLARSMKLSWTEMRSLALMVRYIPCSPVLRHQPPTKNKSD